MSVEARVELVARLKGRVATIVERKRTHSGGGEDGGSPHAVRFSAMSDEELPVRKRLCVCVFFTF